MSHPLSSERKDLHNYFYSFKSDSLKFFFVLLYNTALINAHYFSIY